VAVIVVETGAGGAGAVAHALRHLGEDAALSSDPVAVARAPRLVVTGSGPFAAARRALGGGLDEAIRVATLRGAPLLGIGTGFLVLLEGADLPGRPKGLGLFPGRAVPLPGGFGPAGGPVRVPHLGPDDVALHLREGPFADLAVRSRFFFAHDLALRSPRREAVAGTCHHGGPLDVAVLAGNRAGVLFHPEKSGGPGLSLLRAFARWRPVPAVLPREAAAGA
jgi:glutamine amidotransferase